MPLMNLRPAVVTVALVASAMTALRVDGAESFDLASRKERLPWIWQVPTRQTVPTPKASPASTDVDRFLRARLDAVGIQPAPPTDDRTWLRRVNPDPKSDAKRIAGVFEAAQKAGAIRKGEVSGLAEAVRLINTGVRTSGGTRSSHFSAGNLSAEELRAAARYLRFEGGAIRVVDR